MSFKRIILNSRDTTRAQPSRRRIILNSRDTKRAQPSLRRVILSTRDRDAQRAQRKVVFMVNAGSSTRAPSKATLRVDTLDLTAPMPLQGGR